MKLEATAHGGRKILELKPEIGGETLKTSNLISAIFEASKKFKVKDIAYTVEEYLAEGLATMTIAKAEELGVKAVGFTGGVAFNSHITSTFRRLVEAHQLKFYVNVHVPPGDGGISLGQAYAATLSLNK
jgi:hydrogenase maturation protein HypF